MANTTPRVTSSYQIVAAEARTTQASGNRVLFPLVSANGPAEPTLINSAKQFKETYAPDGINTKELAAAYKLAMSLPLLVVRLTPKLMYKPMGPEGMTSATPVYCDANGAIHGKVDQAIKQSDILVIGDYAYLSKKGDPKSTKVKDKVVKQYQTEGDKWYESAVDDIRHDCGLSLIKVDNTWKLQGWVNSNITVDDSTSINLQFIDPTSTAGATKVPALIVKSDLYRIKYKYNAANQSLDLEIRRGDEGVLDTYHYDNDYPAAISDFNKLYDDLKMVDLKVKANATYGYEASGADNLFYLSSMHTYNKSRVSLISDGGNTDPQVQIDLASLSEDLKAEYFASAPNVNYPKLRRWKQSLNIADKWRMHITANWNLDDTVAQKAFEIPMSIYVLARIAQNARNNIEYAPVYYYRTGTLDGANPVQDYGQYEDELQAMYINPVRRDYDKNQTIVVNNLTTLITDNDLREEHIARLMNTCIYDVDKLVDNFISYDWDTDTCDKIEDSIKSYFNNSIYTLGRVPLEQTEDGLIIKANLNGRNRIKVEVSVLPKGSVKYINILYKVLTVNA